MASELQTKLQQKRSEKAAQATTTGNDCYRVGTEPRGVVVSSSPGVLQDFPYSLYVGAKYYSAGGEELIEISWGAPTGHYLVRARGTGLQAVFNELAQWKLEYIEAHPNETTVAGTATQIQTIEIILQKEKPGQEESENEEDPAKG